MRTVSDNFDANEGSGSFREARSDITSKFASDFNSGLNAGLSAGINASINVGTKSEFKSELKSSDIFGASLSVKHPAIFPAVSQHTLAHTSPTTSISTILSSIERVKLDVISNGAFTPLHRSTFDEILSDLRSDVSKAVLISASIYNTRNSAKISQLTREFPRIPTYALLTIERNITHVNAHSLGRLGIRKMIDVRNEKGWELLRKTLISEYADDIRRTALGMLNFDLVGCPLDCWLFFEILFTHNPCIQSIEQIARILNIPSATLISRFHRGGIPSPKRYIDMEGMIRVARRLENSGLSISDVARQMKYSSPQAFSRSIRLVMKMTPAEIRKSFTGESMIEYFRDRLILPYRNSLRSFRPVSAEPAWITYSD